jgi:hypothetical protein
MLVLARRTIVGGLDSTETDLPPVGLVVDDELASHDLDRDIGSLDRG